MLWSHSTETISFISRLAEIASLVYLHFYFLTGYSTGIQVCSVKPVPDINERFMERDVPDAVRSFYKVNDVCRFQLDRPFHRGEKSEKNEFKVCVCAHLILAILN